jgi:hypothetical protein
MIRMNDRAFFGVVLTCLRAECTHSRMSPGTRDPLDVRRGRVAAPLLRRGDGVQRLEGASPAPGCAGGRGRSGARADTRGTVRALRKRNILRHRTCGVLEFRTNVASWPAKFQRRSMSSSSPPQRSDRRVRQLQRRVGRPSVVLLQQAEKSRHVMGAERRLGMLAVVETREYNPGACGVLSYLDVVLIFCPGNP